MPPRPIRQTKVAAFRHDIATSEIRGLMVFMALAVLLTAVCHTMLAISLGERWALALLGLTALSTTAGHGVVSLHILRRPKGTLSAFVGYLVLCLIAFGSLLEAFGLAYQLEGMARDSFGGWMTSSAVWMATGTSASSGVAGWGSLLVPCEVGSKLLFCFLTGSAVLVAAKHLGSSRAPTSGHAQAKFRRRWRKRRP